MYKMKTQMTLKHTITSRCKKLWRSKNTIVIQIKGGLGNQLFQYAFATALQKTFNKIVILDSRSFYKGSDQYKRVYSLSNFNIHIKEAPKEMSPPPPTLNIEKNYLKRYRFFKISFIDHNDRYNIINLLKEFKPLGIIYATGYWQSAKVVNLCRKELLDDIKLIQKPHSEFYALRNDIKICKDSTTIHFRQSWNIELPKNKISLHTQSPLPIEYYERAINHIKRVKKNTTFFIFADDIKKATKIMIKLLPSSQYKIIQHRDNNIYDYEYLFLMSECSNVIMSNSSFSWWGAWLRWARAQDKQSKGIYIMPHDWNADGTGKKISKELTFSSSIIHL